MPEKIEDAPGQVITFYSFKGGTGRTMALANTACLLAKQNAGRVLMMDWDFEAPGLHLFFAGALADVSGLEDKPGLFDYFRELEQASLKETSAEEPEEAADALLERVPPERFIVSTAVEGLDFIKAGRMDASYPTGVASFHQWENLYLRAPALMRRLAARLTAKYRYVLIDSRTGVSDSSGACTMLLPEKLVVVFTPNAQSLTGGVDVIRRSVDYRRQSEDLRPLVVFPLPSRVETAEPDLRARWLFGDPEQGVEGYKSRFEALFREVYDLSECHLDEYFKEVQIQHVPRYAYGEEIAVLTEGSDDRLSLTRAYQAFTHRLQRAVPWKEPAILLRKDRMEPKSLASLPNYAAPQNLKQIVRSVEETDEERTIAALLLSRNPADLERAAGFMAEKPQFAGDSLTLAYQFWSIGELAKAIESAERGLQVTESASDLKERANLIRRFKNSLAYYYAESGDPAYEERARDYAAEALAEAPDQMEVLDTMGFVKIVYGKNPQELEEGIQLFDRAREKGLPVAVYGEHIGRATKRLTAMIV